LTLAMATSLTALADFSYTATSKGSGMMGGAESTQKHYLKGQKMKTDLGDMVIIMDFDAQTFTTITNSTKSYTVSKFSEMGQSLKGVEGDVKVDVQETGQKQTINGFPAREVVMTMETTVDTGGRGSQQITMESHIWISSAVPGAAEMRAFYQRNASKFPYANAGGRGNSGMAKAMTELQKKMFTMDGIPVRQTTKMQMPGMQAQMSQMSAGLEQAKAQLQKQIDKGGPGTEALKKQLEQMNKMGGGGGGGMETTSDSTGFSTASIPDSVFAIPAGYTQKPK